MRRWLTAESTLSQTHKSAAASHWWSFRYDRCWPSSRHLQLVEETMCSLQTPSVEEHLIWRRSMGKPLNLSWSPRLPWPQIPRLFRRPHSNHGVITHEQVVTSETIDYLIPRCEERPTNTPKFGMGIHFCVFCVCNFTIMRHWIYALKNLNFQPLEVVSRYTAIHNFKCVKITHICFIWEQKFTILDV